MGPYNSNGQSGGMPQQQSMMMVMGVGICCLVLVVGGIYLYSKGGLGGATTAPVWNSSNCTDPSCPDYCTYYTDPVNCASTSSTSVTNIPATITGVQSADCTQTYQSAWEARQEPPYDANSCAGEVMVKSQTCNSWQSVESPVGSGKYIWALVGRAQGCNPSYNTTSTNFSAGSNDLPSPSGDNYAMLNSRTGSPTGTTTFAAARRVKRTVPVKKSSSSGASKAKKTTPASGKRKRIVIR